jgi:hypothetical protein
MSVIEHSTVYVCSVCNYRRGSFGPHGNRLDAHGDDWAWSEVEVVPADAYQGAVDALQAIYDRHHMAGDGSAGKVSGDALRALGIDPDGGR